LGYQGLHGLVYPWTDLLQVDGNHKTVAYHCDDDLGNLVGALLDAVHQMLDTLNGDSSGKPALGQ